jgi:hypothetical protein
MSVNSLNTFLNIRDAHLRVVSGNVHATAMNIGGINVDVAHGLQSVTNQGNVTSNTLQFSNATTAFVTTANVTVGRDLTVTGNALVSSNLTVTGNVTVSDDLTVTENLFVSNNLTVTKDVTVTGNTFYTNPMSISVDSNVVAEYTGPHDRPLRKYPEVAMTANDNSSTSGYVAGASSQNSSNPAYHMFDGIVSSRWLTQGTTDSYDTTSPYLYNGSRGSNIVDISGTPHNGIWLKLELPKAIKLDYNIIRDNTDPGTRTPGKIAFLGSTNGTDWTFLKEFSGMSNTASVEKYTINDTNYYNHFAFVVKNLSDDDQYLDLGEWELYGHEEGDSSLDTTLKSVYNVPGTQQLEVYYDGQDFSGTPSSITDKSGNNITATANNITIDTTYNSFEITSSPKSNIIADNVTFVSGDEPHTYALWVRLKNNSANNLLIDYRPDGGTSTTGNAAGVYILNSNKRIQFYHQAADIQLDYNFVTDTWYHIICSYSGGGNNTTNSKIYINGTEQTNSVVSGSTSVLSLPATGKLTIGDYLYGAIGMGDGNIGNVRLFSKALNADQVRELYDYQKDYFLGSRSSVTLYKGHLGIGVAEPSGQLELAGDERIQEYPPRDLGGFETLVEGQGTYKVSSSSDVANPSVGSSDHPATAFTNDDIFFRGANVQYGVGNAPALYTGTHFTNGVGGDFLQIELPHEIYLKSINIAARTSSSLIDRAPHTGSIFGSNDGGTTWSQVASWSGLIWTVGESKPIQINSSVLYSTYRLVANKLANTSGNASRFNIDRWQLFGTPGPTTLDKGSLTLGRSLDVPRISRYDVDTETPRPEKLVVDFDTTVNSSPTDISGQGNHGVFRESASYSPADKAFNLDGVSKNIRAELNNTETGNQYHSVSLWFKILSGQSSNWRNIFECGENPRSGTSDISLYIPGGQDQLSFSNGGGHMYSDTLTNLYFQWHHIVLTYDGANRNMYLDGALIKTLATTSWAGVANMSLTLGKNNASSGGSEGCDCHISNFKLYWQTALEPSEVRKLYNLGRTGRSMVISDTAVGIGKVPEAQLDVRGNLKVSGTVQVPMIIAHRYINGSATTVTNGNYIPFNGVIYDNPPGLHNGNYFTCPVKGIYECHADMLVNNSGQYDGNHEWHVNNAAYSVIRLRGYGTQVVGNKHNQATSHYYIEANAGDTIALKGVSTIVWYGSNTYAHAHMSIRLITPT